MVAAAGLGLAGLVHAEPRLHSLLKYAEGAHHEQTDCRINYVPGSSGYGPEASERTFSRSNVAPASDRNSPTTKPRNTPHQNTGMRESTSSPAIDQLNAMRARGPARKRPMTVPNPVQITLAPNKAECRIVNCGGDWSLPDAASVACASGGAFAFIQRSDLFAVI